MNFFVLTLFVIVFAGGCKTGKRVSQVSEDKSVSEQAHLHWQQRTFFHIGDNNYGRDDGLDHAPRKQDLGIYKYVSLGNEGMFSFEVLGPTAFEIHLEHNGVDDSFENLVEIFDANAKALPNTVTKLSRSRSLVEQSIAAKIETPGIYQIKIRSGRVSRMVKSKLVDEYDDFFFKISIKQQGNLIKLRK